MGMMMMNSSVSPPLSQRDLHANLLIHVAMKLKPTTLGKAEDLIAMEMIAIKQPLIWQPPSLKMDVIHDSLLPWIRLRKNEDFDIFQAIIYLGI